MTRAAALFSGGDLGSFGLDALGELVVGTSVTGILTSRLAGALGTLDTLGRRMLDDERGKLVLHVDASTLTASLAVAENVAILENLEVGFGFLAVTAED